MLTNLMCCIKIVFVNKLQLKKQLSKQKIILFWRTGFTDLLAFFVMI